MLDVKQTKQTLRRLKAALKYFKRVPEERVDLSRTCITKTDSEQSHRKFARAIGIENVPCGSLACLGGWLHTMPDYKKWREKNVPKEHKQTCLISLGYIRKYIFGDEWGGLGYDIFDVRRRQENDIGKTVRTDKEVAVDRLEHAIGVYERRLETATRIQA